LIRDKVMENLKPYGSKFDWRYLNDHEFLDQLKSKLVDEVEEVSKNFYKNLKILKFPISTYLM
jgi:predicted house-cleaning noncanonical NTP pyrophosphatase (MazG superfamily)